MVNSTGLGNWLHVGGGDEVSDPGSKVGASLTYIQSTNGRVGLEKSERRTWALMRCPVGTWLDGPGAQELDLG